MEFCASSSIHFDSLLCYFTLSIESLAACLIFRLIYLIMWLQVSSLQKSFVTITTFERSFASTESFIAKTTFERSFTCMVLQMADSWFLSHFNPLSFVLLVCCFIEKFVAVLLLIPFFLHLCNYNSNSIFWNNSFYNISQLMIILLHFWARKPESLL